MPKPIISKSPGIGASYSDPIAAHGELFCVHEWTGSGPGYLHVHYADDEAWHVLEGTLTFRFEDRQVEATAGTTVFVPAGVPHDYFEAAGPTRYLIILTPRLQRLIEALQSAPLEEHGAIMQEHQSAIIDD